MKEIEGLTVEAIDWITEKIESASGLINGLYWSSEKCLGCALGNLGWGTGAVGFGGRSKASWLGVEWENKHSWRSKWIELGLAVHGHSSIRDIDVLYKTDAALKLELVNESFSDDATPEERKAHVLAWLRAQRDLKCSDWVPAPVRKAMRKREAVLV